MANIKKLVTTNDLINHIVSTMDKLDSGDITVQHAITISKLHNAAQGWMAYQLMMKNNES